MRTRLIVCLLAGAAMVLAESAESQQIGVAVGYVRTPGRIGDSRSDHGLAARLGLYLGARSLVGVGFEIGFDRTEGLPTMLSWGTWAAGSRSFRGRGGWP